MFAGLASTLLCLLTVYSAAFANAADDFPNVIILSYQFVHDKSSVKPLAKVFYDPQTLTSSISSWTPPSLSPATANPDITTSTSSKLLRVLLPNGSSSLTSVATFNTSLVQTISLLASPNGDGSIYSASVTASEPLPILLPTSKIKSEAETQQPPGTESSVKVKIVLPTPGPAPLLNSRKPPVIGADGRETTPEGEPIEKTFLQKYWWAFVLVAVAAMAGGGDK